MLREAEAMEGITPAQPDPEAPVLSSAVFSNSPTGSLRSHIIDVGHRKSRGDYRTLTIPGAPPKDASLSIRNLSRENRLKAFKTLMSPTLFVERWHLLSSCARRFFLCSLLQSTVVIGLQLAMISITKLDGDVLTGVRHDRLTYAVYFVLTEVYMTWLVLSAVITSSVPQISGFMSFAILSVVYCALQLYQNLDLEELKEHRTVDVLDVLVITCTFVKVAFCLYFSLPICVFKLYYEFGRHQFNQLGAELKLHAMYNKYEQFVMVANFTAILSEIYFLIHLVVLLHIHNETTETVSTLLLALLTATFYYIGMKGTYEQSRLFALSFVVFLVLLFIYYVYKMISFFSETCSFCDAEDDGNFLFMKFSSIVNSIAVFATILASALLFLPSELSLLGEPLSPKKTTVFRKDVFERRESNSQRSSTPFGSKKSLARSFMVESSSKLSTYPFLSANYHMVKVHGHSKRRPRSAPEELIRHERDGSNPDMIPFASPGGSELSFRDLV